MSTAPIGNRPGVPEKKMLAFHATIAPGEKCWILVRPQTFFRPTSLVYVGPSGNFVLHDMRVGTHSQSICDSMLIRLTHQIQERT